MDTTITRVEHEEFARRMEDEHQRISKRLSVLEEKVEQTYELSLLVQKLATNMENMWQELTRQGARLDVIEKRDGETWRKLQYYLITALVGAAVGFITKGMHP